MRVSDSILIAVLIILLLASILAPKAKRQEHFYGYNVLGGGNIKWEDAAQCSDRAIGFQEDTIGRYWGWQDNATCAFFQFSGGKPKKSAPQPQPQPQPQQKPQVKASAISFGAQCGGKGGACGSDTLPCVDTPWPQHSCAPGGTCTRESDQMWKCIQTGETTHQAQPAAGEGSTGAKAIRNKGQTCGGMGGECGTLNGAGCYDRQWDNWTCANGSACQRVNEWHWECK